jgi:hypothetical protein
VVTFFTQLSSNFVRMLCEVSELGPSHFGPLIKILEFSLLVSLYISSIVTYLFCVIKMPLKFLIKPLLTPPLSMMGNPSGTLNTFTSFQVKWCFEEWRGLPPPVKLEICQMSVLLKTQLNKQTEWNYDISLEIP